MKLKHPPEKEKLPASLTEIAASPLIKKFVNKQKYRK
jgi:hypothetical protein